MEYSIEGLPYVDIHAGEGWTSAKVNRSSQTQPLYSDRDRLSLYSVIRREPSHPRAAINYLQDVLFSAAIDLEKINYVDDLRRRLKTHELRLERKARTPVRLILGRLGDAFNSYTCQTLLSPCTDPYVWDDLNTLYPYTEKLLNDSLKDMVATTAPFKYTHLLIATILWCRYLGITYAEFMKFQQDYWDITYCRCPDFNKCFVFGRKPEFKLGLEIWFNLQHSAMPYEFSSNSLFKNSDRS